MSEVPKPTETRGPEAAVPPTPVLTPDEIQQREAGAAASLPPSDQRSIERSAGEGMVGTPVEAATLPTQHIAGSAHLESTAGTPVTTVVVDLQVVPPAWAGTMIVPREDEGVRIAQTYRLRFEDGRGLMMRVTGRAGDSYVVEGLEPFEAAP
jgi:hypothetical protein